jgi:hypothetical protein
LVGIAARVLHLHNTVLRFQSEEKKFKRGIGVDYYHLQKSYYKCIVFYFRGLRWGHWGFDTGQSADRHSEMPSFSLPGGRLGMRVGQRIMRGVTSDFEFLVPLLLGRC